MNEVFVPDGLRRARRELESLQGYRLLQDWLWLSSVHRWVLRFRLCSEPSTTSSIPAETVWVVTVSGGYPWGEVRVYPAKDGGLKDTFPHQSLNEEGSEDVPYRTGNLCLGVMTQDWQIRQGLSEPHTVEDRLRWHVERTQEWVERARTETLFRGGDAWEPPARAIASQQANIVLGAGGVELKGGTAERRGIVELLLPNPAVGLLFVDRFVGLNEPAFRAARELGIGVSIGKTEWGTLLNQSSLAIVGVWIRLAQAPVFSHWRLPQTWGELRSWYHTKESASIDEEITEVLRRAELATDRVGFLLLGYPVPDQIAGPPVRIHWEACSLAGFSCQAATLMPPDAERLKWASVYNQRALMRQVRGQFSSKLCDLSVLLAGAGALGSTVAELLVRGGVKRICIADGESLHLGNLVRHTLTVFGVGCNKAAAVAARLNSCSLDAQVTAYRGKLDTRTLPELMAREPDIVLDTTGSDQVLSDLVGWSRPTLFLSVSLGLYARRIYAFAARGERFPVEDFHSKIQPWLRRDQDDTKDLPQPATEGIGCWSPVFPARLDDIYLLASAAMKWIEEVAAQPPLEPMLAVFEKDSGSSHFIGVRRVQ